MRTPKRNEMGRTEKIVLTEKQERWLAKHFKHTKNDECAARLGISPRSVVRIARSMGLTKSRQFMVKCQRATADAAARSHILNGTYPPKGFRIPNSEAGQFKPGVTSKERIGDRRESERLRKSAESRRKTIADEKRRILFGFEQKTRLKLFSNPKKHQYRYALRQRGYLIERGGIDAKVVAETNRSAKVEANARKYGIRVIE